MLSKLLLVLRTVIHLKPIQVYYQLYYRVRGRIISPLHFATLKGYQPMTYRPGMKEVVFIPESSGLVINESGELNFTFLNKTETFAKNDIKWNYSDFGKLWTYNLNYFDFLFDPSVTPEQGADLIDWYLNSFDQLKDGLEPYPISLRGINWIKFMIYSGMFRPEWDEALFRQYRVLMANIEYHLLANHLLENGFSLLFGAYYFRNESFYQKALKIVQGQLTEQILDDGAHYERSPMYHQILLWRVLDCINLLEHNDWKGNDLLDFLKGKAALMIGWLNEISFSNGDIPMVKDSTSGISPTSDQIRSYARALGLEIKQRASLGASGYRMLRHGKWELLADVGGVSPGYQPGHAHADELNFVLYAKGTPVIVDSGISNYEKGERRQAERSTASHNCVVINEVNSSEVWGGFRVGRRAEAKVLSEGVAFIHAQHNGFKRLGATVTRRFDMGDELIIEDVVSFEAEKICCEMFLHFHPSLSISVTEDTIIANERVKFVCYGVKALTKEKYMFAAGFNRLVEGTRIRLIIDRKSKLIISHVD